MIDYSNNALARCDGAMLTYSGRACPLNLSDTMSLDDLLALEGGVPTSDAFTIAGFNETTPVDTFMNLNGATAYVTTGEEDHD